jgi:hypothetical protein
MPAAPTPTEHLAPGPPLPEPDPHEPPHEPHDLASRLEFLLRIIEDTQDTVRFLDTKAAFCVTLLSGMAAITLQHPSAHHQTHHALFILFMATIVGSLLVCLRVIFPTVKPNIGQAPPAKPRFYIGHNKAHHWLIHTLTNPDDNILSESKTSYMHSLERSTDHHLMSSLAETVLTLAFIRQIKSDRLHTAMFCLICSVFLFATIMLID